MRALIAYAVVLAVVTAPLAGAVPVVDISSTPDRDPVGLACSKLRGGAILSGEATGTESQCESESACNANATVNIVCSPSRGVWCEAYSPLVPELTLVVPVILTGGSYPQVHVGPCLAQVIYGHDLAWGRCRPSAVIHVDCTTPTNRRCVVQTSALGCLDLGDPCDGFRVPNVRRVSFMATCGLLRENILDNPSFDDALHGWSAVGANCTVAASAASPGSSNPVVRVNGTAGCGIAQVVPVDSNPTVIGRQPRFAYGATVTSSLVPAGTRLDWLDSEGNVVGWASESGLWNGTLVLEDQSAPPPGTTHARITILIMGAGSIIADDAVLRYAEAV